MIEEGKLAPNFEATLQDGRKVQLSDYRGKKVVLYFYPKDNTPTCTIESCNLRDSYSQLKEKGYEVLGVSSDTVKSHMKFKSKFDLPFDLIADVDKSIHHLYGTWGEKKLYGREYLGTLRTTFVINEEGIIEKVIEKVKSKEHTDQIL